MNKKAIMAALLFVAAFGLFGCGNADTQYDPYVYVTSETVDSLKSGTVLDMTVTPPEITDEEIQTEVSSRLTGLNETIKVTGRAVKDGDTVNIDYVGKLNGVAFDGGTAEGYSLTIGSNSFIDGFESGLIGANINETLDLDLTFPDDYSNTDLAGQKVVFTVTINAIEETKTFALTDETAKKLDEAANTADEYRAIVKDELTKKRLETYKENLSDYALSDIFEKTEFAELPQELITAQNDALYQGYMSQMQVYSQLYGVSSEDMILSQFGSMEAFNESITEMAAESAKEVILVNAIAKALAYKASYKEIKTYAEENASEGQKPSEYIKSAGGTSAIATVIVRQKVLDYLGAHTALG